MEDFQNVITKVILAKIYDRKEELLETQRTIDEQKITTMEKQIVQLKGLLAEKNYHINDLKSLCDAKIEIIIHKQQEQLSLPETFAAKLKSKNRPKP